MFYIICFLGVCWGFFTFFHGIVKERAYRRITIHVTGFTVLFIEIFGGFLIYDRVFEPLKTGYRWPNMHIPIYVLSVLYVILFMVARWEAREGSLRELAREIMDRK